MRGGDESDYAELTDVYEVKMRLPAPRLRCILDIVDSLFSSHQQGSYDAKR